jgi:hypothetical protein
MTLIDGLSETKALLLTMSSNIEPHEVFGTIGKDSWVSSSVLASPSHTSPANLATTSTTKDVFRISSVGGCSKAFCKSSVLPQAVSIFARLVQIRNLLSGKPVGIQPVWLPLRYRALPR